MMRKTLLKLAFVAAVVVAAPLFNPPSSHAWGAGYVCTGSYSSSVYTGTGSNCTNANLAVQAQGMNEGEGHCESVNYADGACLRSVTVTSSCASLGNGLYGESGYVTYGCRLCGYPNGPICP